MPSAKPAPSAAACVKARMRSRLMVAFRGAQGSRLALLEPEGEAVALPDRAVLLAVLPLQAVGGRQRPDAGGVILGIPRVGVGLRAADEAKARALDERHGVVLAHVARLHLRFLREVGAAAVVD